jgi:hypothetical protein
LAVIYWKGVKFYTTAEIVIGSTTAYEYKRRKDGTTEWEETAGK